MNTGIYYLYEYKNDQKIRNTGFIKLTKQEHTCFLQIHARNIPVTSQDTARFSTFYLENDTAIATELGDISCQNHSITEKATISELNFPNQRSLQQISGFFLTLPHGEILAAVPSSVKFDPQTLLYSTSESTSDTPQITAEPQSADEPRSTAESQSADEPHSTDEPQITAESQSTDEPQSADEPHSTDEPQITNEPQITAKPEITEEPQHADEPHVRKIQRNELSCLPRRHWNLANNSFLLHGYYNYNHLLLIEEDGHYWLGVPGIYDPKESRAAELFGFSQFTDSYNQQLSLTEEECNPYGRFGYWCRYIK